MNAPAKAWRKAAIEMIRVARRLERVALATELPFQVRPHWPGIDWCEHNEALAEFSARVKVVAARLGPPDSVTGEHWLGAADGDHAPDLVARWRLLDKLGPTNVTVRALSPVGCKVDPRTEFAPKKEPGLHPECVAVLRELEDAGHHTVPR